MPPGKIIELVTRPWDNQQRHLQQASSHWKKRWGLALRILRGILTNPIIVMSILGMMVGTFVVKGRDVPAVVNNILVTLGNAFSATALFLLGLTMVERVGSGGSRDQNTSSRSRCGHKLNFFPSDFSNSQVWSLHNSIIFCWLFTIKDRC